MRFSFSLLSLALLTLGHSSLSAHTLKPLHLPKEEALVLLMQKVEGSGKITPMIEKLQGALKTKPEDTKILEKLAHLFIAQARLSCDETLYVRSDVCGHLLETLNPNNPTALLLRGHSLLAMHQFHDAEETARQLIKLRQEMQDYALLGDALMEQGQLEEALPMYQLMIDTKPCMPSYSRVAHLRWLKGDVAGAIEMTQLAVACASYRDPEALAWVTTKLAFYQWQNDELALAEQSSIRAEEFVANYPHALLVRGRVLLAQGKTAEAVVCLQTAASRLPLPEVQWALAEALQSDGKTDEAMAAIRALEQQGAKADPRSFALHLATRGVQIEQALDLAKAEVMTRRDVYSWDALAWSQHAAGESVAAMISARRALAEGTHDARLFLHAGIIAKTAGEPTLALEQLNKAQLMRHQLLPSELKLLDETSVN